MKNYLYGEVSSGKEVMYEIKQAETSFQSTLSSKNIGGIEKHENKHNIKW